MKSFAIKCLSILLIFAISLPIIATEGFAISYNNNIYDLDELSVNGIEVKRKNASLKAQAQSADITLLVGESTDLFVNVKDSEGNPVTNAPLKWTANPEGIVSLKQGSDTRYVTITGLSSKNSPATVTASLNGTTKSVTVEVIDRDIPQISFSKDKYEFDEGVEFSLSGELYSPNGTNGISMEWSVTDEDGVSIKTPASMLNTDANHIIFSVLVTGKKPGTSTVTVKTSNGASTSCIIVINSVVKLPNGYDFIDDSYNFGNYSDNISKKYFTTLFGSEKGKLLYKKEHKAGGLCFGFAYTTAAIYNNYPNITTIATRKGLVSTGLCSKIRDIHHQWSDLINDGSGMFIGDHFLSIEDYIKYAYIYQFSKTVVDNSIWYNNDNVFLAGELLQLVKETTNNNEVCVTIGMTQKNGEGGHRVLAVGYDGNDILVDDPNNTSALERITVNKDGTWSFSGLDNWNSNTCYIRSNVDIEKPYSLLSSGQTTSISNNYDPSENYMEGMDILDCDCNLVSVSSNSFSSNINLTRITNAEFLGRNEEDNASLFWTNNGMDALTLSGLSEKNVEVSVAGKGSIISTTASYIENVVIDVENKTINLSTRGSTDCRFAFENCFENENFEDIEVEIAISGYSDSETVSAVQTDNMISVSGLSEGILTLSINDEVVSTRNFDEKDKTLEIVYDETGNSNKLEIKTDNDEKRIKSVSVDDVTMNYKASTKIKPKVEADEGITYTINYESSNPKVATVDKNGNVYGTKKWGNGTATITCTVTDEYGNKVSDTCNVTVGYAWWQWIISILLFGWIWY